MATKKQKEHLMEVLKFTPTRITINISGYGGEAYAGRVDRKIYDYFKLHKINIEEYANDWDGKFDFVPDDMQPFTAGSPYDCDSIMHESGAELDGLNYITVYNDKNEVIWEARASYSELDEKGVEIEEVNEYYISGEMSADDVVFWGGSGEKGTFFDGEVELRAPFDPKKLKVTYTDCDGWCLINGVEYAGEEVDGTGGYSTTGKWTEYKWILGDNVEDYEPVSREDDDYELEEETVPAVTEEEIRAVFPGMTDGAEDVGQFDWSPGEELEKLQVEFEEDESKMTDWFPVEVTPVRKGEYEVEFEQASWPLTRIRRAEWSGRSWKENGKKATGIVNWRGLKEKPND